MTSSAWPDPDAAYEFPPTTPDNGVLWQAAVTAAIEGGSLRRDVDADNADFVELNGACPRCGHGMSQTLEFDIIVGLNRGLPRQGRFNVRCTCSGDHAGRDEKHTGCGWGGANEVLVKHPARDLS